jgi:hypothetical protein
VVNAERIAALRVLISTHTLNHTKERAMATKKAPTKVSSKIPGSSAHPLYGRPILDAIKRGNVAEMARVRTQALTHIKEVTAALAKLDAKLKSR